MALSCGRSGPERSRRSTPTRARTSFVFVVEGKLIARVGDTRVEVGPGAYAALPRGVPHTIEVVGDEATLLVSFVPGGLERFLVPKDGKEPNPADFGITLA